MKIGYFLLFSLLICLGVSSVFGETQDDFKDHQHISLNSWSIDGGLTYNCNYNFTTSGDAWSLDFEETAADGRFTAFTVTFPTFNCSNYTFLEVNCTGPDTSQILFRVFFTNGSGIDLAYWNTASYLDTQEYDPSVWGDQGFSSLYIAVMTSNSDPITFSVESITLWGEYDIETWQQWQITDGRNLTYIMCLLGCAFIFTLIVIWRKS